MYGTPPAEIQKVRRTRLVMLGLAWVLPMFAGVLHGAPISSVPLSLVYPSVRKLVLLVGIGLQVYHLMNPSSARQRTYEYMDTQGEIGIGGLCLFFEIAWQYTNRGYGGLALQIGAQLVDIALLLGLFAGRFRVVIDGNARKVTIGDLIPRSTSFDALRGLGLVTVNLMRRGAHVATYHRVGLFMNSGAPKRLDGGGSPQGVDTIIAGIAQSTGIPIART